MFKNDKQSNTKISDTIILTDIREQLEDELYECKQSIEELWICIQPLKEAIDESEEESVEESFSHEQTIEDSSEDSFSNEQPEEESINESEEESEQSLESWVFDTLSEKQHRCDQLTDELIALLKQKTLLKNVIESTYRATEEDLHDINCENGVNLMSIDAFMILNDNEFFEHARNDDIKFFDILRNWYMLMILDGFGRIVKNFVSKLFLIACYYESFEVADILLSLELSLHKNEKEKISDYLPIFLAYGLTRTIEHYKLEDFKDAINQIISGNTYKGIIFNKHVLYETFVFHPEYIEIFAEILNEYEYDDQEILFGFFYREEEIAFEVLSKYPFNEQIFESIYEFIHAQCYFEIKTFVSNKY